MMQDNQDPIVIDLSTPEKFAAAEANWYKKLQDLGPTEEMRLEEMCLPAKKTKTEGNK